MRLAGNRGQNGQQRNHVIITRIFTASQVGDVRRSAHLQQRLRERKRKEKPRFSLHVHLSEDDHQLLDSHDLRKRPPRLPERPRTQTDRQNQEKESKRLHGRRVDCDHRAIRIQRHKDGKKILRHKQATTDDGSGIHD